ncbi:MAG: phage tail sheath family protein [Deltaproteobacteria bacterium]|jgi:phage tail sheath protein FI|nr:phage tail sheath family protein [Deltaproteobacteria bacterium]
MAYLHGVYTRELPTSLVPGRDVDTNLPFIVGTAPVDTLDPSNPKYVNTPRLYYSLEEFVKEMGWPEDESGLHEKYTLCEAAKVLLSQYNAPPIVCVNVYNPDTHASPLAVSSADIIGGIDAVTMKKTGLELVSEVFPRFRKVPGIILAPKFSEDPAVAVLMAAKTKSINGLFECMAAADISPDTVPNFTEVPAYKNSNNLTDPNLMLCWPRAGLGDEVYHLSCHLAGRISQTDREAGGTPHVSPSNKRLNITRALGAAGAELWLGLDEVNSLNGEGINTVSNFDGGWKAWGNRTACYPSNTDPKDAFIPIRRFFCWYRNSFILTYFSKVDNPLNRRQIQTILDSEQIRLDGYAAQEIILGGKIEFLGQYNPLTDLMDGIAKFKLSITPPPPNRVIWGIFEFDPAYMETLFG